MDRFLVASAIVVVAIVVAVIARRRRPDPPTQPARHVPTQLDRADFVRPDAPWLVAVFTSATCDSCADVVAKAEVLASDDVAVDPASWQSRRDIHDRYRIDSVPVLVLADADGVVRFGVAGPVSATDLWAAIAAARDDLRERTDAVPVCVLTHSGGRAAWFIARVERRPNRARDWARASARFRSVRRDRRASNGENSRRCRRSWRHDEHPARQLRTTLVAPAATGRVPTVLHGSCARRSLRRPARIGER